MPLFNTSDADYRLLYAAVVEQAAELRGKLDQSLANRIASNFGGE